MKVDVKEVEKIMRVLSSDSMNGRKVLTPGITKAANFIKKEFLKIGLLPLAGAVDFEDTFNLNVSGYDSTSFNSSKKAVNIVGVLPGKARIDEYVVFSAHYDHLGVIKPVNGDSIANGADDDASGTTAVITLARYFKKLNNNERTLVFVTFTAEESGLLGSTHFTKLLDPTKVVAMINIEMIGKESKFGSNAAFITGYERSDLGKILQKNTLGSSFSFYPDPYPSFDLFYRSDNASFAHLGVPAHTISTAQIDKDIYYHTVDDEIETINIQNLINSIEAIIKGSTSIVEGKDTPSRLK